MTQFFPSPAGGQAVEGVFVLDPATGQPAPTPAPLTDAQLRAAPVPVSMAATPGLTDSQLRAALVKTEPLGIPTGSLQLAAGVNSLNTALTSTCRRISIKARNADVRFAIGTAPQTANAATSHFIESGERLDFAVPTNAQIAVIRDALATVDGILCVSELS